MGQSNCTKGPKERKEILLACGYNRFEDGGGKGSHMKVTHGPLEGFVKDGGTIDELPSGIARAPWAVTLPHNPAQGLWDNIEKTAVWCYAQALKNDILPKNDFLQKSGLITQYARFFEGSELEAASSQPRATKAGKHRKHEKHKGIHKPCTP